MAGIALETVNPVVFDDPVYCEEIGFENGNKCIYSNHAAYWCDLFQIELNEHGPGDIRPFKCQECKDHYQRAKS